MKRLIVLVDMDDTIIDLLGAWVEMLNEQHGTTVHPEEVKQWNIAQSFPALTKEQVFEPLLCDDLWFRVKPKAGAVDALRGLIADGHWVLIVTNSAYETLQTKMDAVLFRYFPFINWDNVIITGNKQLVKGDVLIDDGVHNLEGGDYAKILIDAPHNRSYNAEANGMTRVKDLTAAYQKVCEIACA